MALTSEQVAHVAHLARLELEAAELEKMRVQLSQILDYFDMLGEVDTTGVAPTAQVTGLTNAFRDDELRDSLPREAALANAPAQRDGMFQVEAIFDE
jgi:aspartyl-tRNA(Asn)/glutamyl-tRNA(Gln) amidotransferase subunit C